MPVYTYDFIEDGYGIHRPFIPIVAYNPIDNVQARTMALLDTGADLCVFPKWIADRTDHNLKGDGVENDINQGLGKQNVPTWKHSFIIKLVDPNDDDNIVWEGKRDLFNCVDHNDTSAILGSSNFLFNFKITFDYFKLKIHIEIP